MQINITARHGNLSDETRTKIEAKVEKLTRFFERLTAIDVLVDLENDSEREVEILVSAEHKHDFVATARTADLMGTVDQAVHKMEQQVRKYKDRIQQHHG